MIYPEDRAGMAAIIHRADGREFEIEFRIAMPDGSLRWIRDHGFPIRNHSGQVYRIAGIARNVTDRKLADERLKATSEQLRALSASLQSAREEERARIAREIHDELGSSLTSLKWDLEGLAKSCSEPVEPSQLGALRQKTASMMKLTDTIIHTVRRIASELRPGMLDDIGLVDAIEWQAQQFQARTGIACHSGRALETAHLNKEQSTAVFRIFQETLTTVLRHAQATEVDITMCEQKGMFVLTIVDNGRGITDGEKSDKLSLGLLGMQERAHLVGGKVNIKRVKPKGTVVTVQVPTSGALK
jgi:signal transduction histidine kinase